MVDFIRDTQNQLVKVLKDPFYTQKSKDLCSSILTRIYAFLTDFCLENNENQKALYPHISLFLDEVRYPLG